MSQPYDRVFNFSAGPCTLPVEVLEEARDNLMNWKGKGLSVMEMSHRSQVYIDLQQESEDALREVFEVPSNFRMMSAASSAVALRFHSSPLVMAATEMLDEPI